MAEALTPSLATLVKIGSLIVHVEEAASPDGHEFDRIAIGSLMADPDIQDWLSIMRKNGFLPLTRKSTTPRAGQEG